MVTRRHAKNCSTSYFHNFEAGDGRSAVYISQASLTYYFRSGECDSNDKIHYDLDVSSNLSNLTKVHKPMSLTKEISSTGLSSV
jgi:hypothetical protein